MAEYDRRVRQSIFALLILLAAAPGVLPAADELRDALPLTPGTYWIYRGTSRVDPGAGQEPVECDLDVRVLVTDVRRLEEGVCVALLRKASTPLSTRHRVEHFDQSSEVFAYFVDHSTVYEIHGATVDLLVGNERGDEMSLEDMRSKVSADTPAFVFPLTDGQRFAGPGGAFRADGHYTWVVTKGGPIDLLGNRHRDVYFLRYTSLPGTAEVHFVPGVGIVRDKYIHHGTIMEWDLRLVDYHLESQEPSRRDSGSR